MHLDRGGGANSLFPKSKSLTSQKGCQVWRTVLAYWQQSLFHTSYPQEVEKSLPFGGACVDVGPSLATLIICSECVVTWCSGRAWWFFRFAFQEVKLVNNKRGSAGVVNGTQMLEEWIWCFLTVRLILPEKHKFLLG